MKEHEKTFKNKSTCKKSARPPPYTLNSVGGAATKKIQAIICQVGHFNEF